MLATWHRCTTCRLKHYFWIVLLAQHCAGIYDPLGHIESARLYGNIDTYAYYFVDLLVGTPPQRASVIVDTGSGVCAFPCANCPHCGSHIDPTFDFAKSSSATWTPCGNGCGGSCRSGHCSYYQGYTEGSSITGFWFKDYVRLGDTIQKNPSVKADMGCHQDENKLFYTQQANGIMGLSPSSRVLQSLFHDRQHVQTSIFSMCLAEWGGKLNVGGYNTSYHKGSIVWIPMQGSTSYYTVGLTALRLGATMLSTRMGSTIIDSGTTYTYMGSEPYRALKNAIESFCSSHDNCGASRSGRCYTAGNLDSFPTVNLMFGALETSWEADSYLFRKQNYQNRWCYSFQDDGVGAGTTLGASWMRNKDIVFDLASHQIGIVPANCPDFKTRPDHDPSADMTVPVIATSTSSLVTTTLTSSPRATTTTSLATTSTTSISTSSTMVTTTTTTSTFAITTSSTSPLATTTMPIRTTTTTSTRSTMPIRTTTTSARFVTSAQVPGLGLSNSLSTSLERSSSILTTTPSVEEEAEEKNIISWIGDASHGPLVAAFCLIFCCISGFFCRCIHKRFSGQHRHVQLKEIEDSGLPPQIVGPVGGTSVEASAFVIGDDDDLDVELDGFEYAPDNEN